MTSAVKSPGGGPGQRAAWSTLSVRDFFGAIIWTGDAAQEPWTQTANAPHPGSVEALDMAQMTVGDFFGRCPWSGQPDIAAPLEPLEAQADLFPSDDELTLEGFAELF